MEVGSEKCCKTIGITGGIGSGKSIVSRILRCNGFRVYDCDSRARILMEKSCSVISALTEKLGPETYLKDGRLNKPFVSNLIFSDKEARLFVNSVVHKAVCEDIIEERKKIDAVFFVESAILVTSGLIKICDEVWLVEASSDTRLRRVGKRDNIDKDRILKIMESQRKDLEFNNTEKVLVIDNDGDKPILPYILKITDKIINQQTYTITC